MNPYLLAVLASMCFGVVVFPWQLTLRAIGFSGFIALTGIVYFITGLVVYFSQGVSIKFTISALAIGILTALIYATALVLCSYVFTRPTVNIVVAATIVAAYPAWTVLVSVVILKKPMTGSEIFFLVMVLAGIIGLSLNSKPA